MRQAAVESRQSPFTVTRQLRKLGVCHLPMPDHTADFYIDERHTVGPELVAARPLDRADDTEHGCCGLPLLWDINGGAVATEVRSRRLLPAHLSPQFEDSDLAMSRIHMTSHSPVPPPPPPAR